MFCCCTQVSTAVAHRVPPAPQQDTPSRFQTVLEEDPRITDIIERFSRLPPDKIAWLFPILDLDLRMNKKVVIAAVTKNPAMFSKKYFGDPNRIPTDRRPKISPIAAHMRDKNIALAAISVDASAFKRADHSLKTDRAFMAQAASINHLVHEYLPQS